MVRRCTPCMCWSMCKIDGGDGDGDDDEDEDDEGGGAG